MKIALVFINSGGRVRAGWRMAIYCLLTGGIDFPVLSGYRALHPARGSETDRILSVVPAYALVILAALLAAFLMLRFLDRCPFAALGFPLHRRVWVELSVGIVMGFAMVSCVFLIEWIAGRVDIRTAEGALRAAPRFLASYAVVFIFAGAFEEIAIRGYVFQAMIQGLGKAPAVCISSLLFGLLHAANPNASVFGVVNTVLAGVWLSVAYIKTRSLWLPVSLHASWNFALGYIYGFPVSGVGLSHPLLSLSDHGPAWLTGGSYGPEAGAVTTLVLVLATVCLWKSRVVYPSEKSPALWHTD